MGKIKIPKDMDDAKALGTVLSKYKDTYYTQVLVAYFATYVLYPWSKQMDLWRENTLCHSFVSCCSDLQRQSWLRWWFVKPKSNVALVNEFSILLIRTV